MVKKVKKMFVAYKAYLKGKRKNNESENEKNHNKRHIFLSMSLVTIILLVTIWAAIDSGEEIVYREMKAVKGNLTVGITESGNVSIGTVEQTFDVDISEYSSSTTFSFGEGVDAMQMMIPGMNNSKTSAAGSSSRALEIEAVYVTAGWEIAQGTPLVKLAEESVNSIRQELEEDLADAQIIYEQASTGQKQADAQAKAEFDVNKAYGNYTDAEYETQLDTFQTQVDDIQEQLEETAAKLEGRQAELIEMKELLATQQTVLVNAKYARDTTSREDNLYWWIEAVNTVSDTETLIETLESEIEDTEEEIETLTSNIPSLNTQLALAKKALQVGEITAGTQKELRQYRYENAQEIYDVIIGQSSFETDSAKADYEEARGKLEDFDRVIHESVILSEYEGVITEVGVQKGNSLEQDDIIVILNDYGEALITVSMNEEDMEAAKMSSSVNIRFTAFPDEIWKGSVTEIGDAQMNSNTNTATYLVTVTMAEDASGLYEGMSAEVTFITDETAEVIYVSNRAIIKEDTVSYVKVKDAKGKVEKRKVITGFSDGVNVEIKEGLAEGETVLIESRL